MAEYAYHYSKFPALRAYIDRIGADQINFKRFVIRQFRSGYYAERVVIKIVDGCKIECEVEDYKPTEQEAEAIAAELASVNWPHSIRASYAQVEELRAIVSDQQAKSGQYESTSLHVFPDLSRRDVIMAQEVRRYEEDGHKAYVPWTLFMADGESPTWRQMEPDDKLPFWKPPKDRKKASVMIHEGAKAAEFVDDLVNSREPDWVERRKKHPWIEDLRRFEHWGAMGGALAIHRSELKELRQANFESRIFYSCDNDNPGKLAAQTFSREWKGRLVILRYDKRFKPGWDMADELPDEVRSIPMQTFAAPATWATKRRGKDESGRTQYELSDPFADEWVHVSELDLYVSVDFPMLVYTQKQFDHYYSSFSDRNASVSKLLNGHHAGRVELINYRPDLKAGIHTNEAGKQFFNIYVPRKWEEYKQAPDVEPWLDFLTKVFIREFDRTETARWIATFIARPDIKMAYGLLLISRMQGVGKTTLTDILARIVGHWNVSHVREHQIIGRWTAWKEKRLVICPEIYSGHSSKAYNELKEVITDDRTNVERKNIQDYDIDNRAHVIANSNDVRALRLDNHDRRWLVPEVSEHKQEHQYWVNFHRWLDEQQGLRKIVWWAHEFLKTEQPVTAGQEAPWTTTKQAVIDSFREEEAELLYKAFVWVASTSAANCTTTIKGARVTIPGEQALVTEGEALRVAVLAHAGVEMIMLDTDGVSAIKTILYESAGRPAPRHYFRSSAVRDTAAEAGLYVAKQRVQRYAWHNSYVITTSRTLAEMDQNELCEAYASAEEVPLGPGSGEKVREIRLKGQEQIIRVARVRLEPLASWWKAW